MPNHVVGVLLAGGQSRRMGGGDKCLRDLAGKTLLARAIERAAPQVIELILNANGPPERFNRYSLPVIPDVVGGFAGPLAGILTGMTWACENAPDRKWIATFPTDAPFFPTDLVIRLMAEIDKSNTRLAYAHSGGRDHPVFGLWPVNLYEDLSQAMAVGIRKVDEWTARHEASIVGFGVEPIDPFFNANRPEDLDHAESLMSAD